MGGGSALIRPMVSVIVPTYNRPQVLCENLEALSRQAFRDFEVIVVNDCGADVDFVEELYPELSITVVNMESNQKHVHARNRGLLNARGELIMLCDDDDLLLPGHMRRMVKEIEGYDLVYPDVEIFDYTVEDGIRMPTKRFLFAYNSDLPAMRKFSTFVPSGCLYRKHIHEEIGLFDPEVYHYWDWDFFLRAAERFRVKRVPYAGVLYAFSESGDNMSGSLDCMKPYLRRLSEKHGLGELPTKNFFLLLEEPDVKNRRAESEVVWDGQPIISRWAKNNKHHQL
jgi:glycosyltransferase involved in cell wall biosynthesis